MNDVETNMRVARIFDEAAAVVREKNGRYGGSWRHQGWRGNLSRILEKAGRLRSMLWRRDPELLTVSKEHPRETMLDMINTLAFAIINMDDGLEYGDETPHNLTAPELGSARAHVAEVLHNHAFDVACYQGCPGHPGPWPNDAEVTATDLPVPGEEPVDKPSPTKRVAVQDRGSGPRKRPVPNKPQA